MSKKCTLEHLQSVVDENIELGFPRDQATREAIEQLVLSGFDVHQKLIDALLASATPQSPSRSYSRPSSIATTSDGPSLDLCESPSAPSSPAERIAAHIFAERSQRDSGILARLQQTRQELLDRIKHGEADPQLLQALDAQLARAIDNELQRPNSQATASRPSSATTARSSVSSAPGVEGLSRPRSGRRPRSAVPRSGSKGQAASGSTVRSAASVEAAAVLSGPVDTSDKTQAQARAAARCKVYKQVRKSYKVPGRQYAEIDPAMRPVRSEPQEKPVEVVRAKPPRPKIRRGPTVECAPPPPAAVRPPSEQLQLAPEPDEQLAHMEEMDLEELQKMVMAKRQELLRLEQQGF